jgi:hypothetical protein
MRVEITENSAIESRIWKNIPAHDSGGVDSLIQHHQIHAAVGAYRVTLTTHGVDQTGRMLTSPRRESLGQVGQKTGKGTHTT